MLDAHGLQHLDIAARSGKFDEAGLINRLNEGGGRAVHDRHFRPIDFNEDVVDAKASESGEQMFDGGDGAGGGIADDGAQFGGGDLRPARLDGALASALKAGAQKHNSGIGFSRMKNQLNGGVGVHAGSAKSDLAFQRCLSCRHHMLLAFIGATSWRPAAEDRKPHETDADAFP